MKMQYSFELPYPETNHAVIHTLHTHPFVRNGALLSLKNQAGVLKLYGVVDIQQEKVEEHILVVGTGKQIPSELIDRLVIIDSILLSDGKFGYSVYYVAPESFEIKGKPVKSIILDLNHSDDEIDDFFSVVQSFVDSNATYISANIEEAQDDEGSLRIQIFKAGFDKSPEYKEFITYVHSSDVIDSVKVNSL